MKSKLLIGVMLGLISCQAALAQESVADLARKVGKGRKIPDARQVITNDQVVTSVAPKFTNPPEPQINFEAIKAKVEEDSAKRAEFFHGLSHKGQNEVIWATLGDLAGMKSFVYQRDWEDQLYSVVQAAAYHGELCNSIMASDRESDKRAACEKLKSDDFRYGVLQKEGREAVSSGTWALHRVTPSWEAPAPVLIVPKFSGPRLCPTLGEEGCHPF